MQRLNIHMQTFAKFRLQIFVLLEKHTVCKLHTL
jgi:hypothetical protein